MKNLFNSGNWRIVAIVKLSLAFLLLGMSLNAQTIVTIAGNGNNGFSGDGNISTGAQVNLPTSVCRDIYGNIFMADRMNHRVRRIDAITGIITTVAGTGTSGFSGDGAAATSAQLNQPIGVIVANNGTLYISDNANHRVRKVDVNGIITTYAGTGSAGFSADGVLANTSKLNSPWGLVLDKFDNLFIADRANNRVRKVDALSNIITTVAGTGTAGYSGNNGQATTANFDKPIAVAIDTSLNLYIADEDNHRVRKVNLTTGIVTKIAGTGTAGYNGDGMNAGSANLNFPCGVAVDMSGNVYISDRMNHRLRKINLAGNISTIAGTGSVGFSGDGGNATSAQINYPRELFSDGSGNVYFADTDNNRIRKITYCNLPSIPYLSASINTICAGSPVSLYVTSGNLNAAADWQWYNQSCGIGNVGSGDTITVSPTVTTTYFVRGEGNCVTPYGCSSITIQVNQAPQSPSAINGPLQVCNGSAVTYSTNSVNGATAYNWLFPSNWTGSSFTSTANVTAGSLGGLVSVSALNNCGSSMPYSVNVNSITVDTTVYVSGNTLYSNAAPATYQWYNCLISFPVSGATQSSYTAPWSGAYSVIVTQYGCIDTSGCYSLSVTGIHDFQSSHDVHLFPNPAQNQINLKIESNTLPEKVSLYNIIGEHLYDIQWIENKKDLLIETQKLNSGFYLIKLSGNGFNQLHKFMKE